MSQTELLKTQLDNLRREVQRLQVENARLREANPEAGAAENYRGEVEKLTVEVNDLRALLHEARENEAKATEEAQVKEKEQQAMVRNLEERCQRVEQECGQLTRELAELQTVRSREAEESRERCLIAEEKCGRLEHELTRAEFDHYRRLEAERRKWEGREERLLNELQEVRRLASELWDSSRDHIHKSGRTSTAGALAAPEVGEVNRVSDPVSLASAGSSLRQHPSSPAVTQPGPDDAGSSSLTPFNSGLSWTALAQQLPPIQQFTGEEGTESGETFEDWIEMLEMIASICGWDERTKLVNLTTRLRGQAYAFYKSCPEEKRRNYSALVAELTVRFTPVRIRAVQSSLFHNRKQQHPKETVDAYAQDLRRLFYLAYPQAQQGTREAEDMGRSVLSYQFVAGLRQEIKVKLAGGEGTFEELLVKARLEEAKLRDLSEQTSITHVSCEPPPPSTAHTTATTSAKAENERYSERPRGGPKCYNCGEKGHIARNCLLQGRAAPAEVRGRTASYGPSQRPTLNTLVADAGPKQAQRASVAELQRALREAELEEATSCIDATICGVELGGEQREAVSLGPTFTTSLTIEGTPVEAMIDTGSPVTVISLEFLLKTLANRRPIKQSIEDWRVEVRKQLEEPRISLRSYGGARLNVVCQTTVTLARAGFSTATTVYLQKNAPLKVLLGTDVLKALGIQVTMTTKGEVRNLLPQSERVPEIPDATLPLPADSPGEQQSERAVFAHQNAETPRQGDRQGRENSDGGRARQKGSSAVGGPAPDPNMDLVSSSCPKKHHVAMRPTESTKSQPDQNPSIWQGRLRPRSRQKGPVERGRPDYKPGEM